MHTWVVVIDAQHIFADPASPWGAPRFAEIVPNVRALCAAYGGRHVFTRFVAPTEPEDAWVDYYAQWPFARQPPEAETWKVVPELADLAARTVDATTFGKWGEDLDGATRFSRDLILTGVATDCCVLSTALAAADAGVRVRVVTDACAGGTDVDHQRALDAMALYAPLIMLTTTTEVLEEHP